MKKQGIEHERESCVRARTHLDPSVRNQSADEKPKRMSVQPFPRPTIILLRQFYSRRRVNTHKKYIYLKKITPQPINQPLNQLVEN